MTQNNSRRCWKAVFWHERSDAERQRLIYVLSENEDLATDKAWDELANLMDESIDESIDDYYLVEIAEVPSEKRWKIRLDNIFTDEQQFISLLARSEDEAIKFALFQAKNDLKLNTADWDVWECKPIPPGGSRPGAGRPPGRKTKPIRIPLENIEKAEKLDIALDILREWKLRSSLNDKSARFYFLDQAIEELEKHWGSI